VWQGIAPTSGGARSEDAHEIRFWGKSPLTHGPGIKRERSMSGTARARVAGDGLEVRVEWIRPVREKGFRNSID
jgi:hypothetical protein